MSKCIPVEKVVEGMELEVAVKNHYGQMLLPVNTVIVEKHKKIFKTWGIQSIYVKEEISEPGSEQQLDAEKLKEMQSLYDRFKWKPRNSIEEDLFKMILLKISVYDKK